MTQAELEELSVKVDTLGRRLLDLALAQNGRSEKGREVVMGILDSRELIEDMKHALWSQANEAALLRLAYMAAICEEPLVVH